MESEWSGVVDAVRASPQGGAQNWTLASSVNSCHARARRRLTQRQHDSLSPKGAALLSELWALKTIGNLGL